MRDAQQTEVGEGRSVGRRKAAVLLLAVFAASACTAPFGLYHPYHEHHASELERGAALAAHHVTYGSHERCGEKLAFHIAEEGTQVGVPVRLTANEQVGYRRFGEPGHAVIQEYRCIDNHMYFRAWVEPTEGVHAAAH